MPSTADLYLSSILNLFHLFLPFYFFVSNFKNLEGLFLEVILNGLFP